MLAAGAILALSGTSAHAGDASSETVSARGLDLGTQAGAKLYYGRLQRAAADACGASVYFFPSEQERADACIKATLDDAVGRLNVPAITALHRGGR